MNKQGCKDERHHRLARYWDAKEVIQVDNS